MIVNDVRMEDWKLLSFMALLSNYDYFRIQKENEPAFFSTGIERSCGGVLKFGRKFATPVYSEGELTSVIALNESEFDCRIGEFTYRIHALRQKPVSIPSRKAKKWKSIIDLANAEYVDAEQSQYIKELDLLVLVIDPYKLGELTDMEEAQIKRLINVKLSGNGKAMQCCRTVCFECKLHDPRYIIYAGMFDMENSVPRSSVMVYNSLLAKSASEEDDAKYAALWNTAQSIYNEKFS